ncbi:HEPN domain-containing protein [Candidatus Fermentibacteria bacterium]|nr:HEPN domain-containing protein [Candidatus Fermentibacteria bacterium]
MSLRDWLANHWIEEQHISMHEIQTLLDAAEGHLRQARLAGLDPPWRLRMGYEAALNCARAALFRCGYRVPRSGGGHYREIRSLALTVGLSSKTIEFLDRIRMIRNRAVYEGNQLISSEQSREVISRASDVLRITRQWLETLDEDSAE